MTSRDDRGASLVEFALVLPLILMLVVGMVSAGIAYNAQLSLTHAAREAGRYGATLPVINSTYPTNLNEWLDAVAARAVEDAAGDLDPGTPGRSICVAYVHPAGTGAQDQTRRRVEDASGVITDGSTCFADGRPDNERRVQVEVERVVDFEALLFVTTLTLDSSATARFEASLGS